MCAAADVKHCLLGILKRRRVPVRGNPVPQDKGVNAQPGQPLRDRFRFVVGLPGVAAAGQYQESAGRKSRSVSMSSNPAMMASRGIRSPSERNAAAAPIAMTSLTAKMHSLVLPRPSPVSARPALIKPASLSPAS
jgi:hypothetical protein